MSELIETILRFFGKLLLLRSQQLREGDPRQPVMQPATLPASSKTPPKMDPDALRTLLTDEVRNPKYVPVADDPNTTESERKTFCNLFTRAACRKFGWNGFETPDRDQAGEMARFMRNNPQHWQKLEGPWKHLDKSGTGPDYEKATELASRGHLVIASQEEPNPPPTGHVCIVAPEKPMIHSPKWGRPVSIAANVGASNWYGKTLAYAFKNEPELFLYLGS